MRCIDLFAGVGGFTEGARPADAHVVWAINYWPLTVQYYQADHPDIWHEYQDLQQADWRAVPVHDIVPASPARQGHSRARGCRRPHHGAPRGAAWVVMIYAGYYRSPVVLVKDVSDLEEWVLCPVWRDALCRLGYTVSPHLVDATDHDVPQNRRRLFLVRMRSRQPLRLDLPHRKHRLIVDAIQWDIHPWSLIAMPRHSEKTLCQIAAGRAVHGDRSLIPYYSGGSGLTGHSTHRPVDTIMIRDRWAVIEGDRVQMLTMPETRNAMSFPPSYVLPSVHRDAIHLLGNTVCPVVVADSLNEPRLAT